ncbi:SRPBCC family protein [Agrococcus sp. HG114]|uniref:SRPBCC domain-containing protein n=1 Tax=Agrococcus sp. HG114 TaxID=2969757 RepID=UPI00215A86FF|nr:SRPBCC family protein [Agrococcus sp. HG114]MCR8671566.1 SRPBCC family protein [Agrococcus sp. HG114]
MIGEGFRVERAIEIAAHPDRVWDALVDEPSAWWGAPYLLLDGPSTIDLPLRAGEPVVEHLGDASALWGVVTLCAPGRSLAWRGQQGMGSNAVGEVRVDLELVPGGTRVRVLHDAVLLWGEGTEELRRAYDDGWADLLARLRALVETGARHGAAGRNAPVAAPSAR